MADQLRAASAAVLAGLAANPQAAAAPQSQPVTAADSLPAQQQHPLQSASAPKAEAGGWTVAPAQFAAQAAASAGTGAPEVEAGGWTVAPAQLAAQAAASVGSGAPKAEPGGWTVAPVDFAAQAEAPVASGASKAEAGGWAVAPADFTAQAAASAASSAPKAEAGGWSSAPAQFAAQSTAPAAGAVSGPASAANGTRQVQGTATLLGTQAPTAPVMASAAPPQLGGGAPAPAALPAPGGPQQAAVAGGTKPALAGAEMQATERHADGRCAPLQCLQRGQEQSLSVCAFSKGSLWSFTLHCHAPAVGSKTASPSTRWMCCEIRSLPSGA